MASLIAAVVVVSMCHVRSGPVQSNQRRERKDSALGGSCTPCLVQSAGHSFAPHKPTHTCMHFIAVSAILVVLYNIGPELSDLCLMYRVLKTVKV